MILMTPIDPAGESPAICDDHVAQLRDPVRRFVGAQVRNDALADDLTQDIFVRVLKNIGQLTDQRRLAGWVFQIARNVVADYFRSPHSTREYSERDTPESEPKPETVEREERELRDRVSTYVKGVMQSLPPIYREALLLTDYLGMSQVEMAAHLGLSISAAKSRVQRAREMVRCAVDNCCDLEFDIYGALVDCCKNSCCDRRATRD